MKSSDGKTSPRRSSRRSGDRRGRLPMWYGLVIVALTAGALALFADLGRTGSGKTSIDFVLESPPPVQEAYVYAVQHPEVLRHLPCYCGCVNLGHASNLDCFVDGRSPKGEVVYDTMGST